MEYSVSNMHPAVWTSWDLLAAKHIVVLARAFKATNPNNRLHERQ